MTESESLFAELRRRHVIRAAIAHVLVGWLLIQFADVVLPYLGFVDEPVRWAFVISVGTFPITVLIAWFLEHPWHKYTGSRLAIDVIMIGAVALLAWSWTVKNLPEVAQARTSIVILPFEHSGDSREQGLSRAIAYEVNSLLLKSKSIDVIGFESSTSPVLAGLGSMGVADRLSVHHVLSGVVALSDNNMRIDMQLLDSAGAALWETVIEDSVDNLFDVQERIATTIERRLGFGEDTVPVADVAANRCWKPEDTAALEKYYTARYYMELRTETETSHQQMRDAIGLYEELIEEYPNFAEAKSALAWALMHQAVYDRANAMPEPERGQRVRELAEHALADCPTLGEAMHILPNEYDHPNPWIGSHQQLTAFIEMQPEMTEYYQRLTRHYRETGLIDRATEVGERNYAMNPLSVRAIRNLASLFPYHGDLDASCALFDLAEELGATGPKFACEAKYMDECGEDLECFLDRLPPPIQPVKDMLRVVYRPPANDEEAQESIDMGMQLFRMTNGEGVNWLNAASCSAEHLTPLFFELWDATQAMWEETRNFMQPYWFMPNTWNADCTGVWAHPRFPQYLEDTQLLEFWREVGFPANFEASPDGAVYVGTVNQD